MAGYIRQSTFVDGDTITAALFNNEYNQLVNAFSNTSGHKHDGTTAEGPVIGLIGDAGETSPNNKVLIDTTNNYIEFYVEVSSTPVQQLYIADGAIIPVTDSDIDLGTTSLRFKDTYTDTVTTTGNVSIGGDLTVTGSATISGNLTFGDADTDSINLAAEIDSDIIPNTDGTYDLGSATKEWRNLYIDGTANIDSLVADTADINGGTIDGATIATSDITVGAGKTLNVSAGTLTLADNQISGDKVEGGTIAATTITTLTSTTGNITNVNATTVDSTNLEVTNLKAKDGTAAGSIANTTGVVTLASSVLTTTDINGGTIDGVTIGGTTAGAVTFTDLSDGTITIAGFADEDNMVSNSATLLPTQQSVKAYVDSQVTAQDLDITTDSGTIAIDLDSETLTVTGGTGLDSSATGNAVTLAIDSTVATLTGSQTLTNKTIDVDSNTVTNIEVDNLKSGVLDTDLTTVAATDTTLASAKAIKTYVDAQVTAQDLDFQGDTGGALSIDLDSESLTIAGGTGIDTVGLGNTVTVNIDSTVATLTGTQTLTNKTLTSPDVNTPDIDGGTIDSTVIGGATPAAGTFTTLTASTSITGTLATAAQTNITSLGTLTALTGGTGDLNWDSGTLFVDSSANYVGIGTSSPNAKLSILGTSGTYPTAFIGHSLVDTSGEALRIGRSDNQTIRYHSINATQSQTSGDNTLSFNLHNASTSTSQTEVMTLKGSGNVGIGTTSPSAKLTVAGGSDMGIRIISDADGYASLQFGDVDDSVRGGISYNSADDSLQLRGYNNTERLRIDSSGSVGIGTSSPFSSAKLQVNTGTNLNLAVQTGTTITNGMKINAFNDAGSANIPLEINGSVMLLKTGETERMRIDSSGNVLVGRTTAGSGTGFEANTAFGSYILSSSTAISAVFDRLSTDGDIVQFRKDGSTVGSIGSVSGVTLAIDGGSSRSGLQFNLSGVDPRIGSALADASVDLGQSSYRWKDLYLSGNVNLGNKITATGVTTSVNAWKSTSNSTSSSKHMIFANPNGNVGDIRTNVGSTAYITSSDYRLKENVDYTWDATTRLKQLKPARFNFIADETNTIVDGFLAHEVQDIVPEAIAGEKDAVKEEEYEITPAVLDDDGNVVTEAVMGTREVPDYQGIDQSKLVPLLVKTIQELEARITALES